MDDTTPQPGKNTMKVEEFKDFIQSEIKKRDYTLEDRKLVEQIEFWLKELNGEGVTGLDLSTHNTQQLALINGTLTNLGASLAEIEVRLKQSFNDFNSKLDWKEDQMLLKVRDKVYQETKKYPSRDLAKAMTSDERLNYKYQLSQKEALYDKIKSLKWTIVQKKNDIKIMIDVRLAEKRMSSDLEDSVFIPNMDEVMQSVQEKDTDNLAKEVKDINNN